MPASVMLRCYPSPLFILQCNFRSPFFFLLITESNSFINNFTVGFLVLFPPSGVWDGFRYPSPPISFFLPLSFLSVFGLVFPFLPGPSVLSSSSERSEISLPRFFTLPPNASAIHRANWQAVSSWLKYFVASLFFSPPKGC